MQDLRLIEAVKDGDVATIKELIESGADLNQQDESGWTPLNWAAGKGAIELVELLIEKGADVFKVGRDRRTPYMIALAAGHAEVVRLLRVTEERADPQRSSVVKRKYCMAYYLRELRQFSEWSESKINWKEKKEGGDDLEIPFGDDDVVFLHQDLTVTRSMWHGEDIIFSQLSQLWERYCYDVLKFRVPDDLDLIVPANNTVA
jgi:ankyrin repeat protein